jgi:hypothetical protein
LARFRQVPPTWSAGQIGFIVIELGALALLFMVDATAGASRFIPGLALIGSEIGLVMPASVTMVQSAVPEEDQGAISGVSRSACNLGSSLGTAVAGAVLISALISGVTRLTNESTVLTPQDKAAISQKLEGSVSAVSDTQVETALQGQPQEIVNEVVRINAKARNQALALALLVLGAVGLFGLGATFFLPRRTAPDGDTPMDGAAGVLPT